MCTCNQAAVLWNGGIFQIKAPFPLPPGSVLGNPSWHGVFRGTAGGGTDSPSDDGHNGDDDGSGDEDEQHRVLEMYAMLHSLPVAPTTGSAAQPSSRSRTTPWSGGASHQRHMRCNYDVQLIPIVVTAVDLYTRVMINAHSDLQQRRGSMKVNHTRTHLMTKKSIVKVFPAVCSHTHTHTGCYR